MTTFTTDKPIASRQFYITIILQTVFGLCLIAILYFFFEGKRIQNVALMSGVILIASVVRLLLKDKIEEIGFNEGTKELYYYSKGYFSKLKKYSTGFEDLLVRKDKSEAKRKSFVDFKHYSIEVLKGKTLLFTVDVDEDCFSETKMDELIFTFRTNNIPVK